MKVQARTNRFVVVVVVVVQLALLVGLMAPTVSGARDCQGRVGSSSYDLAPLERELRGRDITTSARGDIYYYSVCGVVSNPDCQTSTDNAPAVCQRDNEGHYHDCGSQRTARFEQLPGGGESDGFSLAFSGGQDSRASRVLFKCDPNAGRGSFSFVSEGPIMSYTLQYVSKYACPTNRQPSGPGTVTLCRCGADTSCRDCAESFNYPLGQCTQVRPMCSDQDTGFVRVDQQSSTQFLISGFLDGTCSLPLVQAVTSCGQCNGAVLALCASSRGGLPGWGVALIVVCSLLGALVLALGAAVACLVYHRHRRSPLGYPPAAEASLQVQEAEALVVEEGAVEQ